MQFRMVVKWVRKQFDYRSASDKLEILDDNLHAFIPLVPYRPSCLLVLAQWMLLLTF